METELLLARSPHDRDVHLGVLEVPGNFAARYRNPFHARIAQFEEDRFARHLPDHLGNPRQPIGLHFRNQGVRTPRSPWPLPATEPEQPKPLADSQSIRPPGGFSALARSP